MVEWRDTKNAMMLDRLLALGLLVFAVRWSVAPKSEHVETIAPLWKNDIVPDLGRVQTRHELLLDKNRAGLEFLKDNQLVVYAVYHQRGALSSRTSPEQTSPFRLIVWLIDSKSGEIKAQREWGTRVHDSAVQVTSGGVLIKTGGLVRMYSPDFTQVRNLPIPLDANARNLTTVSPSGRTVLIDQLPYKNLNTSHDHFDVIDASSLVNRYSWDQSPPLYGRYSISDTGIVTATSNGRMISSAHFGSSRWNVVLDDKAQTCIGDYPTLVSDELLVMHCKDLIVLSISSDVSYALPIELDSADNLGPSDLCEDYGDGLSKKTSVASTSHGVALSLPILKIKKHLLAEATTCLAGIRVVEFDLAQKKQNLTLNVAPLPKNDYDFALSPDGSMLAILNDRRVSVYSLGKGQN